MKYLRLYDFYGRPIAEVWPESGDTMTLQWPFEPREVNFRDRYRYCWIEEVEQKMLTAKPQWLEPT